MKRYTICLSIAGSDSGGGAGVQADIKTMSALGVFATTAITAITAQNSVTVTDIHPIPPQTIKAQIEAVATDMGCNAIKIGMLYTKECAEIVADTLTKHKLNNIVLDPVLISTTKCKLSDDGVEGVIKSKFINIATLITPNVDETEALTGIKIANDNDVMLAAKEYIKMGANAVLIKGGDIKGSDKSSDYLLTKCGTEQWYHTSRIVTENSHGTGCSLSSAIASHLALGYNLQDAIAKSKEYITLAIDNGKDIKIGKGSGGINHLFAPVSLIKK